jgi:ThiF family
MHLDLRMAEADWTSLRRHFARSFRVPRAAETGALAVLGERRTQSRQKFLVAKLLLPESGDLKIANSGEVVFDASYIRRVHLEMRRQKLAGIATFHTHPGADNRVGFSTYDDRQDPLLAENLVELEPQTRLISVVVGKQSQCGRLFWNRRAPQPVRDLLVVGEHVSCLSLRGLPAAPPPKPEAIFDRGLALTNSGALHRLSQMTVVVVGASGTGSLMCELLMRAGCKKIVVIDRDIVKIINLNRILHATSEDARRGTPKVEVIRRAIEAARMGCEVEPVCGSILDREILRRVYDGDLIVGCVDRDLPRQFLCDVSFRYLIPYIDLGSEIGGDADGIVSLDSRVSYVAPGRHCLMCSGVVNARRLHFESLTRTERQREVSLGYSDDLLIDQPAVMDLNMGAARQGMLLLRHLLQPFLKEPLPVKLCENAVTYRSVPVSTAVNAYKACPTCRINRFSGYGDCGPSIGFDPSFAKMLLDSDAPMSIQEAKSPTWGARQVATLAKIIAAAYRRIQPGQRTVDSNVSDLSDVTRGGGAR